jgi:hypothetical protein
MMHVLSQRKESLKNWKKRLSRNKLELIKRGSLLRLKKIEEAIEIFD